MELWPDQAGKIFFVQFLFLPLPHFSIQTDAVTCSVQSGKQCTESSNPGRVVVCLTGTFGFGKTEQKEIFRIVLLFSEHFSENINFESSMVRMREMV